MPRSLAVDAAVSEGVRRVKPYRAPTAAAGVVAVSEV